MSIKTLTPPRMPPNPGAAADRATPARRGAGRVPPKATTSADGESAQPMPQGRGGGHNEAHDPPTQPLAGLAAPKDAKGVGAGRAAVGAGPTRGGKFDVASLLAAFDAAPPERQQAARAALAGFGAGVRA